MRYFIFILMVFLSACNGGGQKTGEWKLNANNSSISFVSVKKNSIGEIGIFGDIAGNISEDGTAEIKVNLDSINTNIDIRDERMREHLFHTGKWPQAIITAKLNPDDFLSIPIGARQTHVIDVKLDLHGKTLETEAEVYVFRLQDNVFIVQSKLPVILDLEDFDMLGGIEKLKQLAGLPSIATSVPISFSLEFGR